MKNIGKDLSFIRDMERLEREMDKIDDIIDERSKEDFALPPDFDPTIAPGEHDAISGRCEAMRNELASRGFQISLDKNMPLKVLWLYAQHVAFITEGLSTGGNYITTFTGCGGWCEGCFQSPWCSAREEVDREEEEEQRRELEKST